MKITKGSWIAAFGLAFNQILFAQDVTGHWQGVLDVGGQELRIVAQFEQGEDAAMQATIFSIDQDPDRGAGMTVDSVVVKDNRIQVEVPAMRGSYDGRIAADGNSMVGTWTQGGGSLPLTLTRATPETAFPHTSSHSVQFVTVDEDVELEVLDWGGEGRTLLLIAGLGNTAHAFDAFAARLTEKYRVVGMTRRGFGASSAPATGYGADRLGDDVLAVMQALKLEKPVLVGHSLGGEELSSVGSRQPEKVAGLVYLDAAYSYAFYAPDVDQFPEVTGVLPPGIPGAIMAGVKRYTRIPVPILAIYALPHVAGGSSNPSADEKREAFIVAFERSLPNARVVRISNASHFVFRSHEADVLREMNAFIEGLD